MCHSLPRTPRSRLLPITHTAPGSVAGVLHEQWIVLDLHRRDRKQHLVRPLRRLELTRAGVRQRDTWQSAHADQILTPLRLAGELEQTLLEDRVARLRLRHRGAQ